MGTKTSKTSQGSIIHATCVSLDGCGVLLLGPPGSGKSDLALRLIAEPWPTSERALLVSDDRVSLSARDGWLFAAPPETIAGRLEVRGVAIHTLPHCRCVRLRLAVDLVSPDTVPRLPGPPVQRTWLTIPLPVLALAPFEASATIKLRLALEHFATTS